MNMQKYASYKKAAKRIVRLLNEEREMKKEAGLLDWIFPPNGSKAKKYDSNGNLYERQSGSGTTWRHPTAYVDADVYNPDTDNFEHISEPRWQVTKSPDFEFSWRRPSTWFSLPSLLGGAVQSKDPDFTKGTNNKAVPPVMPVSPLVSKKWKDLATQSYNLEKERARLHNELNAREGNN